MSPLRLEVLLRESLAAWNVQDQIAIAGETLAIKAGACELAIARAPSGMPFRWMLHDGARNRAFASIPALLRGLRQILDPAHPITSVRIAQLPVAL